MISPSTLGRAFPIVALGEVAEFLDSRRRPVTASDRREGPYPYYGANGIQGTIDDYLFDEPLLLLAEDGGHFDDPSRGIAYRITGKTWVNNHAHVLRPGKRVLLSYLHRVLENYDVTRFITGTTRGKLTQAGAAEIPIPLPTLSVQGRIADILDHADVLRVKRRLAVDRLGDLAQSIFFEFFGDPTRNSKGWPESRVLGDVADIVSGITKGRKLNGVSTRAVKYLAVLNVQDRRLDLNTVKTIQATEPEIARYRLERDDLLLTEGGDPDKLGRGSLWNEEIRECIHQNHIFRVRLRTDDLTPLFLEWLIGSSRGKKYFLRSAKQTTGIASINLRQLRAFPLLTPPLALQQQFATAIECVTTLTSRAEQSLSALSDLFVTLQHRAFRGEL